MKEFKYTINGNVYNVNISDIEGNIAQVEVNGSEYKVVLEEKQSSKPQFKAQMTKPAAAPTTASGAPVVERKVAKPSASGLKSPLPGVILSINVNVGDTVKKGQLLLILEAMKMENNINSDRDGKITAIKVNKGDSVLEGAELIVIE